MLSTSARVGAAMTSGGMAAASGSPGGDRIALALGGRPPDDLAVDCRRKARCEEPRVVRGDRVDDVDQDLDHRLLPGAELRPRRRSGR